MIEPQAAQGEAPCVTHLAHKVRKRGTSSHWKTPYDVKDSTSEVETKPPVIADSAVSERPSILNDLQGLILKEE